MSIFPDLGRASLWLLARVCALWVRPTALPLEQVEQLRGRGRRVIYVLAEPALSDLVALQLTCLDLGLPPAVRRLRIGGAREARSALPLERRQGLFVQRRDRRVPEQFARVVAAAVAAGDVDIDLVPVAVFWGRAPARDYHWLRLMFSAGWAITGRLSRLLSTLVNGRAVFVHFGTPQPLSGLVGDDARRAPRRIVRHFRQELATTRTSVLGPDLSHRRTIAAEILGTRAVRLAVAAHAREKNLSRRASLLAARRCVYEIAADYSPRFVTIMSHVLGRLWTRLYDGVEVRNADRLGVADRGAQLVYVPAHRSHMDYLLLSYVIYHRGYPVPHIAAGVNLNLPVVGRLLRKGGAFYVRRGYRGDPLYPAVFAQYLALMMARGHSVEYFIEGGRSRTGRLLAPKTGMLSMTVRGFLNDAKRPVVFMPVYFGYERIFEAREYLSELSGRPKSKESLFGLLSALPKLKRRFGRVYVSFGQPLPLTDLLDAAEPAWRLTPPSEARPPWLAAVVAGLAARIEQRINQTAAVSPVALVSMVLLAMPRQAMVARDLQRQVALYQRLLTAAPGGEESWTTPLAPDEVLAYVARLGFTTRVEHPLGDIVQMSGDTAILCTYPRNNVLHLFALPSLLACAFLDAEELPTADLLRLGGRVYPYIAEELCLPWSEAELPAVMLTLLGLFVRLGLLTRDEGRDTWRRPVAGAVEAMQLSVLARAMLPAVQRYYLVIATLMGAAPCTMTQAALEARCQMMASRIAVLYEFASPEFSDRALFRAFIDLLRERSVIEVADDGTLGYGAVLEAVAADARSVLAEQIRHSILQVTHS